ncbi:hypothetical protein OG453_33665 [Streptomyces sp. NBC_01381]|uniref:hypothetical protein n=1 Tax=Streptomyces sp. NBC_01381 TaxID=2903845 RepID=UPI002254FB12|nr:hypothetical protein [Streptomyces sp. NBC_01381]MCX4671581.1 hypothetical protein [Streptomyces sp. NBC_01381]
MPLDELSPEDRRAVLAERRTERDSFWPGKDGAQERTTIKMYPLLHVDKPNYGHTMIRATDDMKLRRIVEAFGKCFRRELRFDFPPFSAERVDFYGRLNEAEVVLFDAQNASLATFPIAAGAAGLSVVKGQRVLDWIWLHPFERGQRLMDYAWNDLEAAYGDDFLVQGPLSRAMEGFLTKQEVALERWKR